MMLSFGLPSFVSRKYLFSFCYLQIQSQDRPTILGSFIFPEFHFHKSNLCALEILFIIRLQMSVEESESQQEFQNDEASQDNHSNEDQDNDGDKINLVTCL